MEMSTKHLSGIKRKVEETEQYSIDPYGISSKSSKGCQKELKNLLQRKQELKSELLAIQEQKMLCECFENPVQWMAKHQSASAERELSESEENRAQVTPVLDETAKKIHGTINLASTALTVLQESLRAVDEKMAALQSEVSDYMKADGAELDLVSLHQIHKSDKSGPEKLAVQLDAVKKEHQILENRYHRLLLDLNCLQQVSEPQHQLNADSQKELNRLMELKTDFEQLAEVRCILKGAQCIDVIFTPRGKQSSDALDTDPKVDSSVPLVATISFEKLADESLQLNDVKLSENVMGSEEIIERAKSSLDIPRMVMDLKSLWTSSETLFSEISHIRDRHAVDWIQEEGILRVMVGKGRSVVCTLHIPEYYPRSGEVSLGSVIGDTSDIALDQIQAPADSSLTGWILHLGDVFSKQ